MADFHNDVSDEALWSLYSSLSQQARQLQSILATPRHSDRLDIPTLGNVPRGPETVTPIRPGQYDSNSDENDPDSDPATPRPEAGERQITIILSSPPVVERTPAASATNKTPEVIELLSSSSNVTGTPPDRTAPSQRVRPFPVNLTNPPAIQTARADVLNPTEERQARRRIMVTSDTVARYTQLVDSIMGIKYNISTEDPISPDTSDSSISDPAPIDQQLFGLITASAYVDTGIVEATAYDINNLGLATDDNYYIGRFDHEGRNQPNYARFQPSTWRDLVTAVGALGADFDTAYPLVCDYLRTKRKLVTLVNLRYHATVLTLVHSSKTATFFDTWPSDNNRARAHTVCSSVIRSIFNETTAGWTLLHARVGHQNTQANNCGLHSLLRIRDELEDENRYDTSERSANTLRLYLAVRHAYGEETYPLSGIIRRGQVVTTT